MKIKHNALFLLLQINFLTYSQQLITNPKRFDGFGAQFSHVMASAVYAEAHGMKFVYTPFSSMEHNYDGDPTFLAKKEWLINFIGNFEINTNPDTPKATYCIDFFNSDLRASLNSAMFKKIKKIFRANKNIDDYFDPARFNIAVHVRRPNSHDTRLDGADTPDQVFLNIINKLRVKYKDKKPLFHVYSQGSIENFEKYMADDIILHLNDSTEYAFTAMVLADVLVVVRSAFSYVAGLLSEGTVYYIPIGFQVPNWILLTDL